MKKKKSKRKSKHKPTCPNPLSEYEFGFDFGEYNDCNSCSLYDKCKVAHDKLLKKTRKKKSKSKSKRKKKQDHRPILIPTAALNELLKLPTPHNTNCVVLYLFYLKKAITDKTNRIWCTDSYVAGRIGRDRKRKGLKWDKGRVAETKRQLVKLKYIKIIQLQKSRDERGHFGKNYIEVKYYASKMKIEKAEYVHQLDELVEEAYQLMNSLVTRINKLEVENAMAKKKYRKLKRKYKRLKQE